MFIVTVPNKGGVESHLRDELLPAQLYKIGIEKD